MKKILILLLLTSVVFSLQITEIQTVSDALGNNPTNSFDYTGTVWHKVTVYNNEDVSYPKIRIRPIYTYARTYTTGHSYYVYWYWGSECQSIDVPGIDSGETVQVVVPCRMYRNDTAPQDYRTRIYLYREVNGVLKYTTYKYSNYWSFTPKTHWIGGLIRGIYLNESNSNSDGNRFPVNHKFNTTIEVENIHPTDVYKANITFNGKGNIHYGNCEHIKNIEVPPLTKLNFTTNCTTNDGDVTQLIYPLMHSGPSYNVFTRSAVKSKYIYVQTWNCGNSIAEVGENCDSPDLRSKDCTNYKSNSPYEGGTLGCTASCTWDVSQCQEAPPPPTYPKVSFINANTDKAFYEENHPINLFVKFRSTGTESIAENSYLELTVTDLVTSNEVFSDSVTLSEIPRYDYFEQWFNFNSGSDPLFNFEVKAQVFKPDGTLISGGQITNTYSPATSASDLNCINTSISATTIEVECTHPSTVRQLLKMPTYGGELDQLSTTPPKGVYSWQWENYLVMIDNPLGTTYNARIVFGSEAPESPALMVILIIFITGFMWFYAKH